MQFFFQEALFIEPFVQFKCFILYHNFDKIRLYHWCDPKKKNPSKGGKKRQKPLFQVVHKNQETQNRFRFFRNKKKKSRKSISTTTRCGDKTFNE